MVTGMFEILLKKEYRFADLWRWERTLLMIDSLCNIVMPWWTLVYLENNGCLVQPEVRLTWKGRQSWSWRMWSVSDGGCPGAWVRGFSLKKWRKGRSKAERPLMEYEGSFSHKGESLQWKCWPLIGRKQTLSQDLCANDGQGGLACCSSWGSQKVGHD